NGHIFITPIERPLDDYVEVSARIETAPGVIKAVPLVEGQALVSGAVGAGTGALVRGVRISDFERLGTISENIIEGSAEGFRGGEGVAIGFRMAQNLGLIAGDLITLVSPEGDVTPFGTTPRVKSYPVEAIFDMGMSEYDSSIVIMPLEEAQLYFNQEGVVQLIEVFINDPDEVDTYNAGVEAAAARPVITTDWRQRNRAFFSALVIERNAMFMILSIVIIVASLNIISSLIMLVKEKGRGIAILRTMGATQSAILRIFIMAGTGVGVVGTGVGVIIGVLVCLNIKGIQQFINWVSGTEVWDPTVRFLTDIPARIDPWETLAAVGLALALSFFAAILPAMRAARLDPVEALRYE
ncbi:MAG: FtsX-like permease family protein, partial [Pseudomonadota bacterium]